MDNIKNLFNCHSNSDSYNVSKDISDICNYDGTICEKDNCDDCKNPSKKIQPKSSESEPLSLKYKISKEILPKCFGTQIHVTQKCGGCTHINDCLTETRRLLSR